jgi:hypothetical protein
MRSRALRLAVLVFQALWLNVIVPGHRRGIVQMPGAVSDPSGQNTSNSSTGGETCPFCVGSPTQKTPGNPNAPAPAANCAICFFAAHLSVPPVIDFAPPLLCLARVVPATAPMAAPFTRIPLVLHDRAPPVVA